MKRRSFLQWLRNIPILACFAGRLGFAKPPSSEDVHACHKMIAGKHGTATFWLLTPCGSILLEGASLRCVQTAICRQSNDNGHYYSAGAIYGTLLAERAIASGETLVEFERCYGDCVSPDARPLRVQTLPDNGRPVVYRLENCALNRVSGQSVRSPAGSITDFHLVFTALHLEPAEVANTPIPRAT